MIQRIQTIYLLIIAALMAAMLLTPLAHFYGDENTFRLMAFGVQAQEAPPTDSVWVVRMPWMGILMILAACLPLVTIFFYKQRKIQVRFCIVEAILLGGVQIYVIFYLFRAHCSIADFAFQSIRYTIPDVFPLTAIILAWLALRAIIHDEALVRSIHRIR